MVIVDQVTRGLANQEIQKDVLSSDPMDLEKLLLFVEGKESGLASQGLMIGTSGAASVVKPAANTEEVKKPEKCRTCGFFPKRSCKNGRCYAKKKTCNNCGQMGHLATVCKAAKKSNRVDHVDPEGESQLSDCSIFLRDNKSNFMYPHVSMPENDDNDDKYLETLSNVMTIMVGAAISATTTLHHHVFDTVSQNWKQRPARNKPWIDVKLEVDKAACKNVFGSYFGKLTAKSAQQKALADTGASVCLAGAKLLKSMGLQSSDLATCDMKLYGASGNDIRLLGIMPTIITDVQSGRQTRQMLYFCEAADLLLSMEACSDLSLVVPGFPNVGGAAVAALKPGKNPECPCKCPVREVAPDAPTELPMDPTPENVPELEKWIRNYYAASAFNCCECQPLPSMHGPPVKIHLQEDAVPVASHSPIPIPLHWHKEVKAGLDRDEAIGVIERVPSGSPTTWCHKMVCVPKKDNTPRRTVNFVPLNRYSSRQTHHTMSPFHQAPTRQCWMPGMATIPAYWTRAAGICAPSSPLGVDIAIELYRRGSWLLGMRTRNAMIGSSRRSRTRLR